MSQNGSRRKGRVIAPQQFRGARGLVGWSQTDLAKRAGLSLPTVKRVELDAGPRVSDEARHALQRALETSGVIFIEANGGGPGVRLKKTPAVQKRRGESNP